MNNNLRTVVQARHGDLEGDVSHMCADCRVQSAGRAETAARSG
jgi:hypothetical protein